MKKKVNTVFLLLICSQIIVAQTVNLNTDWQFRQAGTEKWFPATAPGQVHTDLLENQLIDDPFIYANYKKVQWIGFKDWEYRTEFDIDKNILEKEKIELVFPGLDTYADVYLNDFMILTADNMFRNWRVDAKNYLKKGKNTLRITFKSVYKVDLPKYMDAPFELKAWQNNDQSDIFLSLYARKAGYHYGWDWSARFLSCGVWKMPFVDAWNKLKIVGVHIFTEKIQKNDAFLRAIFEVESTENQNNTNFKIENKNN
ncbi:MAG: glycoside hydrolase family 2 protein, partial [Prevotellaceae bacterium]|nr:glycoside hydrolase family 2 protein [Prevotellaceae bacterium]